VAKLVLGATLLIALAVKNADSRTPTDQSRSVNVSKSVFSGSAKERRFQDTSGLISIR